MGKIKLLLDVVEDIRSLADSLEAVADAMNHSEPPTNAPESPDLPENVETAEEAAPAMRLMGKEELREFLSNKSLNGHTDTIHAMIVRYGGKKFSDVDPKHYPAMQKEAEALPDAP